MGERAKVDMGHGGTTKAIGAGGKAAAKKLKRKENSKVSKGRALQGAALGANVKHRANQSNTTGPEDLERGLVGRADVVEARRALATQTFTPEALGIKIGQKVHKVPTSEGMQTIFAAEAHMDVQKKLLAARQPFPEDFTPAVPSFDVSSQAAAAGMPLRPKWHRGMLPAMDGPGERGVPGPRRSLASIRDESASLAAA